MSRSKSRSKSTEDNDDLVSTSLTDANSADEDTRDPTLFLFLWLGVPMILMIVYAIFGHK